MNPLLVPETGGVSCVNCFRCAALLEGVAVAVCSGAFVVASACRTAR